MRNLITALTAALILLAVSAAGASANISLSGGTASIAVEPSFTNKLAKKKVTPSLVSPATGSTTQFAIPVRGGLIVQSKGTGTYRTTGGIAFAYKSRKINIANLRFTKTGSSFVSATVGGSQMVAFRASAGTVVRAGFNTDVRSIVLRLTDEAAARINSVLKLSKTKTAFAGNQLVGVATINSIASKIEVAGGGRFRVALDQSPQNKLAEVGVKLTPMKPSKTSGGKLIFPGAGGGYLKPGTLTGPVNFSGGLSFKRGSSSLKLRYPVVNIAKRGWISFTRSNGSKIKFAHIDPAQLITTVDPATRKITLTNAHLTLTNDAARLLKSTFKTTRFAQDDPLGVATMIVNGK
ncbi:MAG: hypothetical protein JHC98_07180 [Thermoleophilaceae bacterium]|nr:hypothetical protein [Thermoleophilaceae bacterium]